MGDHRGHGVDGLLEPLCRILRELTERLVTSGRSVEYPRQPLPADVRASVQRILDRVARRILEERLNRHRTRAKGRPPVRI